MLQAGAVKGLIERTLIHVGHTGAQHKLKSDSPFVKHHSLCWKRTGGKEGYGWGGDLVFGRTSRTIIRTGRIRGSRRNT